jgi:hypothetical protein
MQFSPTSYHLVPLQSKYFLQYPVFKYVQSVVTCFRVVTIRRVFGLGELDS